MKGKMEQIAEYIIIGQPLGSLSTPEGLSRLVNKKIKEQFQPYGSMVVRQDCFYQPMVRRENVLESGDKDA